MLFPKKSLLILLSSGKIAHHVKPDFCGHKKIFDEIGIKKQPKVKSSDRHFLEISANLGDISLSSNRVRRTSFVLREAETVQSWSFNVRALLSSGFMLLGIEYFYPIYAGIKKGKPNLPLYFERMGPIYFKGTRLVDNDGEIIVPYIEYVDEKSKWLTGFKKSFDVIPDTQEFSRTLSVYVKKEPRKFKKQKRP